MAQLPMHNLEEKVKQVEAVFVRLDQGISAFQAATTLHCKWGCGKCCFKPDIEATALEFLPFAYHLYQHGLAEAWHERLQHEPGSICLILDAQQSGAGLCSQYTHRGLICRLFGYSARTNKYSQKELVTCQIIKTEQSVAYETAARKIETGELAVPVMNEFYMQLRSVDPDLGQEFYPINRAIRKAIEQVLHYFAYRNA